MCRVICLYYCIITESCVKRLYIHTSAPAPAPSSRSSSSWSLLWIQNSLEKYRRCEREYDGYDRAREAAMQWLISAQQQFDAAQQLNQSHEDLLTQQQLVEVDATFWFIYFCCYPILSDSQLYIVQTLCVALYVAHRTILQPFSRLIWVRHGPLMACWENCEITGVVLFTGQKLFLMCTSSVKANGGIKCCV